MGQVPKEREHSKEAPFSLNSIYKEEKKKEKSSGGERYTTRALMTITSFLYCEKLMKTL